MVASSLLRSSSQMEVQNGVSIAFWLDSWLIDTPLYEKVISEVPLNELQKSVASYWSPSGWCLDTLHNYLPYDILSLLMSVTLRSDNQAS